MPTGLLQLLQLQQSIIFSQGMGQLQGPRQLRRSFAMWEPQQIDYVGTKGPP